MLTNNKKMNSELFVAAREKSKLNKINSDVCFLKKGQ